MGLLMKVRNCIVSLFCATFVASCATVETASNVVPAQDQVFEHPYNKVYSRSISTLMDLKWQASHSDKKEGLIQARTPMTIWTAGDLVTVHVFQESDSQTRVEVTSASAQQYDWGKNKENISKFYFQLSEKLKSE